VTDEVFQIRLLLDRYSDAANRLDPDGMVSDYAPECVVRALGNEMRGRDYLRERYATSMGRYEWLQQVMHGVVIDVDGDKADVRWWITEHSVVRGEPHMTLMIAGYDDKLEKRDGRWLFVDRQFKRRAQWVLHGEKLFGAG